ncbi:MAG: hypothetical protein NC924_10040, partial [Candidatus Omnitrophica bacterium]|nr:hypothetical protein [Candidatus Omnitrophota bacterium]
MRFHWWRRRGAVRLAVYGVILSLICGGADCRSAELLSPEIGLSQATVAAAFRHTPAAWRGHSPQHTRRNEALAALVPSGAVVLITQNETGTYEAAPFGGGLLPAARSKDLRAAAEQLLQRAETQVRQARDGGALDILLATKPQFSALSESEKNEVATIAAQAPLLVVKGRVTLHPQGAYAHARLGTYPQTKNPQDAAIWLGEVSLLQLSVEHLGLLLLEEAMHIAFPDREFAHDESLYQALEILRVQQKEIKPDEFCERDMSLELLQSMCLDLRMRLLQRLELSCNLRVYQMLESDYAFMERLVPNIWNEAVQAHHVFRYEDVHGLGTFEYALIQQGDYAALEQQDHSGGSYFYSKLKEAGGFSFYFRDKQRIYLLIDGDLVQTEEDRKFVRYIAANLRAQALVEDSFRATLLEFALCAHDGKVSEYLQWLKQKCPQKFFAGLQSSSHLLSEDASELSEAMSEEEYEQFAAARHYVERVVDGFDLPAEVMEVFALFEIYYQEAENLLTGLFDDIRQEVDRMHPASYEHGLSKIGEMIGKGIAQLQAQGRLPVLNMQRLKSAIDEQCERVEWSLTQARDEFQRSGGNLHNDAAPEVVDRSYIKDGVVHREAIIAELLRLQAAQEPLVIGDAGQVHEAVIIAEAQAMIIEQQEYFLTLGQMRYLFSLTW